MKKLTLIKTLKKKRAALSAALAVFVVIALVVFVAPVQSFALSVLSALRVQDVHAITITADDIQQFAKSAQSLKPLEEELKPLMSKSEAAKAQPMTKVAVGQTKVSQVTKGPDGTLKTEVAPSPNVKIAKAKAAKLLAESGTAPAPNAKGQTAIKVEPKSKMAIKVQPGESLFTPLTRTRDFRAFDFVLPKALSNQTPQLGMVASQKQALMIDASTINPLLVKLGATKLPTSLNKAKITVQTPAVALAQYKGGEMLIETQMPVFTGNTKAISALQTSVLSWSGFSASLRAQLSTVDLTSGTVYVPVFEGFGQQTAVGNSAGYIYTASELKTLVGSLPSSLFGSASSSKSITDKLQSYSGNASALIWAHNGVLYILAGNQSASALTQIAKSIR